MFGSYTSNFGTEVQRLYGVVSMGATHKENITIHAGIITLTRNIGIFNKYNRMEVLEATLKISSYFK